MLPEADDQIRDAAERIAPVLPQFEESEHREGQRFSSAVAADPTADRVQVSLTCPACGARTEVATTMLRPEPTGRLFTPGTAWPMRPDRINGYWYFDVRATASSGPFVVLDGDCCRSCGTDLWFELTFEQGMLASTRQSQLTNPALERCHVCSTRASMVAAALVGGEARQLPTQDVLHILRAQLRRPIDAA